jgi:sialate O-acetylesterase
MKLSLLFPLLAFTAVAEVRLPAVLTDHMVLQRGLPVHVWGRANSGEAVSVTFRDNTRLATADSLGSWSVYLPPSEAGGPFDLMVKAENTILLRDVLVGDVWIASGQSNMEFRLREALNSATEIAAANRPRIRLFQVNNRVADHPMDDVDAKPWAPCSPETARNFSAVAYFFGRHLEEKLFVPIGLISSSWGGTPAESWTSLHALTSDAALMPVFSEWSKMSDDLTRTRLRREKQLTDWRAAVDRAQSEGKPSPGRPWAANDEGEWAPSSLFNAMIAPLTRFPIRGAIWYQGESNASAERAGLYRRLFGTMIQDWRRAWGVGDFPFLFVQLANFTTGSGARWPELREAQTQTLQLTNTGMAVTIDIGESKDIHPKNKQDVGLRLALAARAVAYAEPIEYSGPLFKTATPEGDAIRVYFDHTGRGLQAKSGDPRGFEIASSDRKFVPAEVRIDGRTVVVRSAFIASPRYVRYAWKDDPSCNLYNAEGLPASPFRSAE